MVITSGGRELVLARGAEAARLLRLAERAHLPEHFSQVLAEMERLAGPITWLPFGGAGRVAHSAIGAAASGSHLLTEPVVNMLDALLEMAQLRAERDGTGDVLPRSTYEAAQRYFAVPPGGLPAWEVRRNPARALFRELAMLAQVIVRPGSTAETPSFMYLDSAIGQHPTRFDSTLLSLHLGNKADIPYLSGQYGHGAGLTLAFSLGGQVIVARRHPDLLDDDQTDLVGLVLIERRMPSETGMANPSYWYAVPAATQTPLAFAPDALSDPRWHGVRRTCINYEIEKSGEWSIWLALDHYLAEPPLPYAFHDERGPRGESWQWRYMSGAATRLESHYRGWTPRTGKNPVSAPYRSRSFIDLGAYVGDGDEYGTVELVKTYVRQENTNRGNELFAPVKEAEVWTLNGQTHHTRPRTHFGIQPIGFDAIRDYLVVEAKLDDLSPDAKAILLTTDRQGAAERALRRQLEAAIDEDLRTDDELRRLNDEAKEEALRKAAAERWRDLDRELEEFEFFVGTQKVEVKTTEKRLELVRVRQPRPVIKLDPISPLHAHPTFLRFRKRLRATVRVRPGATASVLVESDAIDGYFGGDRQPSWQFLPPMGTALQVYSKEELRDGRMRVRIKARLDAALGLTQLTASYLPPNATAPLTDSIDIEIAPPKPTRPRGAAGSKKLAWVDVEVTKEIEKPAPPPYQVLFRDQDPTWEAHGMGHWTEETVGEFAKDIAFVNGDYRPLRALLDKVQAKKQRELLALYAAPIIMTLVGLAKEERDPPRDDGGDPVMLHDRYREAALQGVALSSIFTIRKLRKLGLVEELDEEDEE